MGGHGVARGGKSLSQRRMAGGRVVVGEVVRQIEQRCPWILSIGINATPQRNESLPEFRPQVWKGDRVVRRNPTKTGYATLR